MKYFSSCLLIVIGLGLTNTAIGARFWVAAGASNWNNIANWSASSGGAGGASVPLATDDVNFDNNGLGNCTIDVPVSVKSITVAAGFTGTISQGTNTISVSTTAAFGGGIFLGGSANITVVGAFTLSGTTFTSSSGTLELRDNATFTSGTFLHNNGTVRFNCINTATQLISGTAPSFFILEFVGIGRAYTISTVGNLVVLNSLNLSGSLFYNLTIGGIDVKGDINVSNTASGCGGDALVTINGAGTQNFNGNAVSGQGALPQLSINKSTGTLNLANFPSVANNFTYIAGTVNAGTSTFCFTHGSTGAYTASGSLSLNNIEFNVNSSGLTAGIAAGTTLTANGNLNLSGAGNTLINTGTINVNGNIVLTNTATGGGGSATINIVGTSGESIDGTAIIAGQCRLPIININKSAGTLTLLGNISFSANLTYTAGIVNAGTSTSFLVNNLTITGSFTLFNVSINTTGTVTITIASGSTLTVANDYTMQTGALNNININTGTIAVQGNIIDNNTGVGGGGTGTLLINGTGAQSISSTGVIYQGTLPAVTLNKSAGTLTLPSLITERSNWTYIAGTLDVTTNNSTVVFGNTLTIAGSHNLNNVVFDGAGTYTITIAAGTTLGVNGNMGISGANNIILNTGTINLLGNINLTNTATGGGGNATINIAGTGSQAITGALSIYQSSLPAVTINKALGTLTFPALITVRGNWTFIAGAYDVATNNSNIIFGNSLTITGTHSLNNITFDGAGTFTFVIAAATTLTATGTMTMSGTSNIILNTGTINLNGNLVLTNTATAGTGTAIIAFVGSASQSIISSLLINQCNLPAVTINKPTGTLIFPAIITVRGNWTYTSGILDAMTNNSTVVFNNNLSIAGSHSLNNVNLEGNFNNTYSVSTGTVLTVTGTLTTSGSSNITLSTPVNGATAIQAQGDLIINNTALGGGGNGTILINGAAAQAFTGNSAAGHGPLPLILIQKTSGTLTLTGILSESQNWTYASGIVDATSNASTVVFGGNNLNIAGNGMSFFNTAFSANTSTLTNSLSVNNNLTISGAAVLAPGANTINLAGNWTNWGTAGFSEATSTVNFNGSALQSIICPAGENFTNLTVNNTGAGIQLGNNITVAANLVMTRGNIDLNAGKVITLGLSVANNGTLTYTGGVMLNTGSFTRWIKAVAIPDGSITGFFPMGNAANNRSFFVSAPSVSPTTGGTLSVSYTDAASKSAVSFADGASTVSLRVDLNWALTPANGLAGGTYDLGIQGTGYGTVGNTADLRLTLIGGVVGAAGVNAGTTANPQVNRTGLTLANLSNTFFVASVNAVSSPLPITLLSFTASVVNDHVELDWVTSAEINNDYFTVQRSKDGAKWDDLQLVRGSGITYGNSSYAAYDQTPYSGLSYYRILQTDLDGKQAYSFICAVRIQNPAARIAVFPNPATNSIVVTFPVPGNYQVRLFNSAGKLMNNPILSSGGKILLDVSNMEPGIYLITISHDNSSETRKVTID